MIYRELGSDEIRVSAVGFGVWTVSTSMWSITDEKIGANLLNTALQCGITFFDTADVYGDGRGETILADALAHRRNDIIIATKFGYDFVNYPGVQPGQRERPHDWSPEYVRRACEASLKRLKTDHIDLYQLHNPRLDAIRRDDLWAELETLKSEGKIRAIGAALGPALNPDRQSEEGIASVRERGAVPQIIYNMLEQPLGQSIFPVAREANVPVITRVPHASGLLEGNFTEETNFGPNDHRSFRFAKGREWLNEGLRKVDKLQFLTGDGVRTIGQAAIQFILNESCVASVLPNIYEEAQLRELAEAPDKPAITIEEMGRIQCLYDSNFDIG